MVSNDKECPWCNKRFEPRTTGGKPQRFCSRDCTRSFHDATRQFTIREMEAGRVSIEDLKRGTDERAS